MRLTTYIFVSVLIVSFIGCKSGGQENSSKQKPGTLKPSTPVKAKVRNDDFVNTGPYVKPTIKNGRFIGTREYSKGRGKYPVEFSMDIPKGWKMIDIGPGPGKNLVQFLKYAKSGGEVKIFAVGHFRHTGSYTRNVKKNIQLLTKLMNQMLGQFKVQFDQAGLKSEYKDLGITRKRGILEYRVDFKLDRWINKKSPPGPYYFTMLCRPRLDHKPHGVLFMLFSRHDDQITSNDKMLQEGEIAELLKSFRFEN